MMNHLCVFDSLDSEPLGGGRGRWERSKWESALTVSRSGGGQSGGNSGRKKEKYLNCVLGLVWVELGGHTGQEENVSCFEDGSSVVGGSSSDLPLSLQPLTVARQPINRTALYSPSLIYHHHHHHPCFLDANAPDQCSTRHDTLPVRAHQRRGRGGEPLYRSSGDWKGFLRHSLQGIPFGQPESQSPDSPQLTQTIPPGNPQASCDKDRQQEQAHHKAIREPPKRDRNPQSLVP